MGKKTLKNSNRVYFEQVFLGLIFLATLFVVAEVEFFGEASTAVFTLEGSLTLVNVLLVFVKVCSLNESYTTVAYEGAFPCV